MRRVDQRIGPADALVAEIDANADELPGNKLGPLGADRQGKCVSFQRVFRTTVPLSHCAIYHPCYRSAGAVDWLN